MHKEVVECHREVLVAFQYALFRFGQTMIARSSHLHDYARALGGGFSITIYHIIARLSADPNRGLDVRDS